MASLPRDHGCHSAQGPDFMLLAGQFSSAPKVLELIWALDRKLTGESLNDKSDLLPRGPMGVWQCVALAVGKSIAMGVNGECEAYNVNHMYIYIYI